MADILWTKAELEAWAAEIGGRWRGTGRDVDCREPSNSAPNSVSGISIDSRSIQKGDAFFAIKGDRVDGHDYADKAAEAGANLLVLDEEHKDLAEKLADDRHISTCIDLELFSKDMKKEANDYLIAKRLVCLIVPDVMKALRALGRMARARLKQSARVLAVTGSVGKTTVKEMLALVFAQFGRIHKNPASFNNHWGVPLTLARMPRDTDYAIFEIGMNHAGEITPLVQMVRPHLALITKIAAVHMEHFENLEEIAAAKAEIFSGLEGNSDSVVSSGIAVLPRDDAFYGFLAEQARLCGVYDRPSFGCDKKSDYALDRVNCEPGQGIAHIARRPDKRLMRFRLNAPGEHLVLDAVAVLACAGELLVRPAVRKDCEEKRKCHEESDPEAVANSVWQKAVSALAGFTAPAGRGARCPLALPDGGSFMLIDESYNANPTSMRAALMNLGEAQAARRIAVLGDMLELGAGEKREHENLADVLLMANVNIVFLTGALMLSLAEKLESCGIECYWREKADGMAEEIEKILRNGDCVMVKSSHSIGTERIVKKLLADYQKRPQTL